MPKHPRKKVIQKPKKEKIREPWKIAEADMPHTGDIWRHRGYYASSSEPLDYHYLLLEPYMVDEWDGLSWTSLCLENGLLVDFWMNFELDDWSRVE